MVPVAGSGPECRFGYRRRRWSFEACVFDEAQWSLTVDGRRVPVETKPLELLRELLARAGNVVSKDELLDTIWPDVTVVEASLPTAVRKLRLALGDDCREQRMIETVRGIGYRLTVPVEVEEVSAAGILAASATSTASADSIPQSAAGKPIAERRKTKAPMLVAAVAGLAIASAAVALALKPTLPAPESAAVKSYSQGELRNALRKLDVETIEKALATGWDPNTPFDNQGNDALIWAFHNCEWDPGHDRRRMLLMARTLIDGGARLDRRNAWGDTPYSIAKSERYCGPDHPVTNMIRTICYSGHKPPGDRCLASYEQ